MWSDRTKIALGEKKYFQINIPKTHFHCLYVKLATVPKCLQNLSVLLTGVFRWPA